MKYLFSLLFSLFAVASAVAMDNADVIKMVQAGLSEDVIVSAINGSKDAEFSTEPMDLIELKEKGVSDAILQAMLNPGAGGSSKGGDSGDDDADKLRPDVVTVNFDGQSETMRYIVPTMRTAARAFGFGGVATYMVMRGTEAQLKMEDRQPVFEVSIPSNAQPEGYVDLASFAVRDNGSREVLVGGGYMSYSTGIHPDRRMPFTLTKLDDQSRATDGFTLYTVQPSQPLESGQYALVFYNAEIAVPGFFGSGSNSCFDFTVR